ncbi:hypothetical protein NDU88_005080 [Pleurodeles waltl]|uniref:Uncharacterized protein n=1 Tax=Pleurodeles waltl TaxID=8319 RepID=A0AAV7SKT1_PLEWA|nr:hypothetical protein NDU88_005080 [Pleurodeles waltl]
MAPSTSPVQVTSSLTQIPPVTQERETKQLDTSGMSIFASSSLAVRSTNTSCVLACFFYILWDAVESILPSLTDEARTALTPFVCDSQQAAKLSVRCGMDTTDSVGLIMASSVALRSKTWLRSSNFSEAEQDMLLEMPLDGKSLFSSHAD